MRIAVVWHSQRNEQYIFRRNMLFGMAIEHRTMFIDFSCDHQSLIHMLARMEGAENGVHDALTRSTPAVSRVYYFVLSAGAPRRFATGHTWMIPVRGIVFSDDRSPHPLSNRH